MERLAVLVGFGGQLSSDLMSVLKDYAVAPIPHSELEITDRSNIACKLGALTASVVVNTAAFHNVEQCELNPTSAFAVNSLGVDNLAAHCASGGIDFVTLSTDYVFDGAKQRAYIESDAPNPLNAYAVSKYAGELLVKRHGERYFIIRTAGLYGIHGSRNKGYTFIEKIFRQAEASEPIRVVDDMFFSPSYSLHVAQGIRRIFEGAPFGTYHVAGSGYCSWYDFAKMALELGNLDADIAPVKYADFNSRVRRPMFSALENRAMKEAGLPDLPHWKDGLRAYLAERAALKASSA